MKRKRFLLAAILLSVSLGLSGCGGDFPELTDEEMDEVGGYAARLLLKYDANHRSRLVSMEEVEAREERDRKRHEAALARAEEEKKQQGMDPVDPTKSIDHAQNVVGGDSSVVSFNSMQEYFGLPAGVQVVYSNCEITDTIDSDFFSVEAAEGKSLVVAHFRIENQSGEDQLIDILSQETSFKGNFNGSYNRTALTTMMPEDLTTYRGHILSGLGVNTVLVFEVDKSVAEDIQSLTLNLKNESKIYTIQLL